MDRNKKAQEKHPFSALIIQNFIGGYLPSRVSFQPILHRPDFVRQYKKRRQFSLFSLFSLSSPCGVACCGLWIGGGVLPLACIFVSSHIIPQKFSFFKILRTELCEISKINLLFSITIFFIHFMRTERYKKVQLGKTERNFPSRRS